MITLNQDKVNEIKRNNMPVLSPVEFEMKLRKAGIRQQVLDYVAQNEVLSIVYNKATFFYRNDQFLKSTMKELNLTDEQVDQMWVD